MALNDDLLSDEVRRAHYVERFKNFEVKKIDSLLNNGLREIRKALAADNITSWNKTRYESMLRELTRIQRIVNRRVRDQLELDLKAFGESESGVSAGNLQTRIPINVQVNVPSAAQIWTAANANPLLMDNGFTMDLTEFLDGFSTRNIEVVKQTLRQGYLLGKPSAQIAREMTGINGTLSRRTSDYLVRTSMNHLNSITRRTVASENLDIVKGYTWVAVLDRRTTPVCANRDGSSWIYRDDDRAKFTGWLLEFEEYPPAHGRCRSTITYITRSWNELGIKGIQEPQPGVRASMNGEVSARLTYKQWLVQQPAGVIQDVLGKTRYELWNAGRIRVDSFYAKDGRLLTLKELEAKGYGL